MSKDELKACPFCGGEAEIERKGTQRASMIICCVNCGCKVESGDVFGMTDPAYYTWNTRPAQSEAVGVEELVKALEDIIFTASKLWDEVKNIKDTESMTVTHPIIEQAKQALSKFKESK